MLDSRILCLVTHLKFFSPDPAQGFPTYSQVRGDVVLAGLLLDTGMLFEQKIVANIGGMCPQKYCPFLAHDVILLRYDPAKQIALWKVGIIGIQLVPA